MRSYLGESVDTNEFAQAFIARRSKCKSVVQQQQLRNDDQVKVTTSQLSVCSRSVSSRIISGSCSLRQFSLCIQVKVIIKIVLSLSKTEPTHARLNTYNSCVEVEVCLADSCQAKNVQQLCGGRSVSGRLMPG